MSKGVAPSSAVMCTFYAIVNGMEQRLEAAGSVDGLIGSFRSGLFRDTLIPIMHGLGIDN